MLEIVRPTTTGVSSPNLTEAFWFSSPVSRNRDDQVSLPAFSSSSTAAADGAAAFASAAGASAMRTSKVMDLEGGASSATTIPHSQNHAQQPAVKVRIAMFLPALEAKGKEGGRSFRPFSWAVSRQAARLGRS